MTFSKEQKLLKSSVSKEKLYDFFSKINDKEKFENYLKVFKSFSKEKQGRSGAEVGSISDKLVMKISSVKFSKKAIVDNECLFLKSQLNEIIINYVLTNLEDFVKLDSKEIKLKKTYLLSLKDFGITNNKSYIINEKVGTNVGNNYLTNLSDILKINHLPKIKKDNLLSVEYQKYFIKRIVTPIDTILTLLHKKIDFYHTDFKLDNIFIKEKTVSGYDSLKKNGIFLNFIPLISDLDKSRLILKGRKILPIDDKKIVTSLGSKLGYEPLLHFRYKCQIKYGKEKCIKFNKGDFDILLFFINVYLLLHMYELVDLFSLLDNYVMKRFKFTEEDMMKFKMVMKKSYKKSSFLSKVSATNMSGIIYQICKKLEY